MDPWQFGVFFGALLLGYVLVHLRLVRCEAHLHELAGIRSLDDRLRRLDERLAGLGESSGRLRLDRVEALLERLHEDLEDLTEATASVRSAVVQIPPPTTIELPPPAAIAVPVPPPPAPPTESWSQRVCAAVDTRLQQLGYSRIQILDSLAAEDPGQDLELRVEAERHGMPSKGRVLVRNGRVLEVALQSVAAMFP
ncbi:MAG: hypothetical protein JNK49_07880 [Planctomycetes bacterium]|nr:hypothetical protein [Planctomycetota bacterium]